MRILLLRAQLQAQGISIDSQPLFTIDEARRFQAGSSLDRARVLVAASVRQTQALNSSLAPTAFVSRQAGLDPSGIAERAAVSGRAFVYDVDDAIWHSARREAGGHPLALLKRSRSKAKWLARHAQTVIAGNSILAEWLADYSDNVTIIPSTVDSVYEMRVHEARSEAVLGWIGSHSTLRHLERIGPDLSRLAHAIKPTRLRVLIVGGPAFAIEHATVEAIAWSEAAEHHALSRIDVGLMPLADDPWTRGKCAYKALQYMAAGIPVVADDVGIAREVVERRGAGIVIPAGGTWKDAVGELLGSVEARSRMGEAGREVVRSDYSPARWVPTLASILRGGA